MSKTTQYRIVQNGNSYTPQYKGWIFWNSFYHAGYSDSYEVICDSYKDAMQVIFDDKAYVKPVVKITNIL